MMNSLQNTLQVSAAQKAADPSLQSNKQPCKRLDEKTVLTEKDERRFWRKVEKTDSCWLWTASKVGMGYGKFDAGYKTWRSHRVSWLIHHGELPASLCVLHKCDVPACVNPDHLFLGTNADNRSDMTSKGRSTLGKSPVNTDQIARGDRNGSRLKPERLARGIKHGKSVLNEAKVISIRTRHATGKYTHEQIGKEFGIAASTVLQVVNRHTWRHIA